MRLSEAGINERLQKLKEWNRKDEKWIEKKYRFREFLEAIQFVNEVAAIAERLNHHPLISIDYKVVTLKLTTWSEGGLTELDFTSAAAFDGAHERENGVLQSGFHAQSVKRENCKFPQFILCEHDCENIVQLVSHHSGDVCFELCEIEAEKMAEVLLKAVSQAKGRS